MASLRATPVTLELRDIPGETTGNLAPLLSEIREALRVYLDAGTPTTIDLLAMPFGPGDEAALLRTLGTGEVSAELQALGCSRIWESRFGGVWLVEHANQLGERMALQVEIADVPVLLRSQPEDMRAALEGLDEHLSSLGNTEE